jgi:hypothetical protein
MHARVHALSEGTSPGGVSSRSVQPDDHPNKSASNFLLHGIGVVDG